ncbi:MAG: STAS domain-containing protein [Bacteroidetes bacterium]|nr:STAS domain-containing protein [Bacteroidota bacterium]MCL5739148.1 STAS domain-containing protein [Bacteroidota bacterium]
MNEFKVLTRDSGNAVVMELHGFLDAHTAPELEKTFSELIGKGKFNIVVNFSELNYISSAGLGVFMAYIDEIRTNHGDIKLANMQQKVYNVFDLLGFPFLYEIYKDQDEALRKFSNH